MMAAAQPFISGAISKTINLPNEATVEEIKHSYQLSWELGLKANALYRDGSKLSQPLNVKSDEDLDEVEEDDEEERRRRARKKSPDSPLQRRGQSLSSRSRSPQRQPRTRPMHTHVIEKIIERIVERPLRRRLPDTRHAITHKFDVAGHEGYITAGLYEDGQPGEVFITHGQRRQHHRRPDGRHRHAGLGQPAIRRAGRIARPQIRTRAIRTQRHDPQPRNPHGQEPGRLHLPLAGDGIRPRLPRRQRPTPRRPELRGAFGGSDQGP